MPLTDRMGNPYLWVGTVLVLLLLLVVSVVVITRDVRVEVARKEIATLVTGLRTYRRDCGGLPAAATGPGALVASPGQPGWKGPYVTRVPLDPWGNPYAYAVTTGGFDVSSSGSDGVPGTADDVR